eukprot:4903967-Prorocentrum_lima.AAC.1
MTSSLVGSEMCIRDRKNNVLSFKGYRVRDSWITMLVQGVKMEVDTALEPVCYTHLTLPTICSV